MIRRVALAVAGVALATPAIAQGEKKPEFKAITGHVLQAGKIEATPARIQNLKMPEGFKVELFAKDLVNPRMLAVADDGTVYVTRRSVGDVVMLRDSDQDGKADDQQTVATRPMMHGIAIRDGAMYLATVNDIYRADIAEDGTLGELQRLITDLPDGGQHPNRTLAFGPDGMLYVSVGSTCNACGETNPESATLVQMSPDGKSRRIYASGLRNTIGFGWHPQTGELYGMDHGIDWLGDQTQKEELNRIQMGKQYGWPYVYEDGQVNPADEPPGGISPEQWARMSEPMVLGYDAHAAPMQMAFARGTSFPADYKDDAFVAMRGSWNAKPATGYEIVRISFENGKPVAMEPFVSGFLVDGDSEQPKQFGRPVGLAFMPDGSMLFTDDVGGAIYRVTYQGGDSTTASGQQMEQVAAAKEANAAETMQQTPAQLAMSLVKPKTDAKIEVKAASFRDDRPIAFRHSAYGENVSPELSWSGAPEGTQSFVIMMEDPDAAKPKPFVHWIAYNIPKDVEFLREGLPTDPKLRVPGMLQGQNSAGASGYFGPKPPDDKPHHYHFQIFALDAELELDPGKDRKAIMDAMQGHVLASGEIVGIFQKPQTN
jgi:Raf kinase inhibitor-like YbhB/YbcL family protein